MGRRRRPPPRRHAGRGLRRPGLHLVEELLRTDLARVIHATAGPSVTHWFGDTVESLGDSGDRVRATFRHAPADFDLVVGADGAHSRVRALAFGPEDDFRHPLGLAHAWFTLTETPSTPGLDGWMLVHNAPGRLVVEARPGHDGHQEVGFSFSATTLAPAHRPRRPPGPHLRPSGLAHSGATGRRSHRPRLRPGHLRPGGHAHLAPRPRRPAGRQRLVRQPPERPRHGAGPPGAESLARALTAADSRTATDALATADSLAAGDPMAAYEREMRPRVTAQKMYPGRVRSFAPETERGIRTTALVMRLVQSKPAIALLSRLVSANGRA